MLSTEKKKQKKSKMRLEKAQDQGEDSSIKTNCAQLKRCSISDQTIYILSKKAKQKEISLNDYYCN